MSPFPRRRVLPVLGLLCLGFLAFALFGGLTGLQNSLNEAGEAPWEREGWVNSGVLGDADGDGEVSDGERADLKVTEDTVATVVAPGGIGTGPTRNAGMAAGRGVETLIVTPAGTQWWKFIASQAYDLAMWDSPAPTGVDWFAFTEGRAYNPAATTTTRYSALHLAFPTEEAAQAWAVGNAAEGVGATTLQVARGRVLTITPAWVDVAREPFGPVDELALSGAEVKIGLWQAAYDQQFANHLTEVADPDAYAQVWTALGFDDAASWAATSPTPDAAWVGRVAGFRPGDVDGQAVVAAINTSYYACEDGSHECRAEGGLSEAINEMWIRDGDGLGGGDDYWAPTDTPQVEDAALRFTYTGSFRGALNATLARSAPPVRQYDTWVTQEGLLTVRPVFQDPAAVAPSTESATGS